LSGSDARRFWVAGINNVDDSAYLNKAGVTWYDAENYLKSGFTAKEDIVEMISAGVDGYNIGAYTEAGVVTKESVIELVRAGVGPWELSMFMDARVRTAEEMLVISGGGVLSYRSIVALYDDGLTRELVKTCYDHNMRSLQDIMKLARGGVTADEAARHLKRGTTTPEEILEAVSSPGGRARRSLKDLFS
jgi:hypothetical protein